MPQRRRAETEWITAKNHHEPYITPEEWQRIQAALQAARPTIRPHIGRGSGLLQGLAWCGRCERWMHTVHWDRTAKVGHRRASYACRTVTKEGATLHEMHCRTRLIDEAVTDAVLAALSPIAIQSAVAVIEEQRAARDGVAKTHARQLRHAEDEVDAARRRYQQADPKHKAVRTELEADWERAIQRRDDLRRHLAAGTAAPPVSLDRGTAETLVELSREVRALWEADTTTNEDRKHLLRTVLIKVIVRESNDDAVLLELLWAGGLRQPVRALRSKGVDSIIVEKRRQGTSSQAIADELNAARLRDAYGKPFSAQSVRQRLHTLGANLKVERRQMFLRLHQLLCDTATPAQMLEDLQGRFPRAAPRTVQKLKKEVMAVCRGIRGVPGVPPDIARRHVRRQRPAAAVQLGTPVPSYAVTGAASAVHSKKEGA